MPQHLIHSLVCVTTYSITANSYTYRRVQNIRISAHFTHLRKFRNFVFATEVMIFSDHNPLMYLRECAPKSEKLTRWALGLQEFMHANSDIFHTSVKVASPQVPIGLLNRLLLVDAVHFPKKRICKN